MIIWFEESEEKEHQECLGLSSTVTNWNNSPGADPVERAYKPDQFKTSLLSSVTYYGKTLTSKFAAFYANSRAASS
jgi:hypothetical protein